MALKSNKLKTIMTILPLINTGKKTIHVTRVGLFLCDYAFLPLEMIFFLMDSLIGVKHRGELKGTDKNGSCSPFTTLSFSLIT